MALKLLVLLSLVSLVFSIPIPCAGLYKCSTCTFHGDCFYNIAVDKCQSIERLKTTNKSDIITAPYDCPVPPPDAFPYSDDFARNRALVFSGASSGNHSDQIQPCLNKINAIVHSLHFAECDAANSTCFAFLAIVPDEKAIAMTFRGSKGDDQMKLEFINIMSGEWRRSQYVDGKVLTYFIEAFEALWESGLEKSLQDLRKEYPDYELWVFGHSLGASLASIGAFASVKTGLFAPDEVKAITLGQIRTGSLEYAQSYDRHVPYTYRIVHGSDVLTKLPRKKPTENDGFYHHRFEVWYNNTMKVGDPYEINQRADDWSGSNTYVNENIYDMAHLTYFNVNIVDYINHC